MPRLVMPAVTVMEYTGLVQLPFVACTVLGVTKVAVKEPFPNPSLDMPTPPDAEKDELEGVAVINILHPKLTVCPSGKEIVGEVVTEIPKVLE